MLPNVAGSPQLARYPWLYVVPVRRIELRRHIPAGRTMHLLDLENLMGGPFGGREAMRRASDAYRANAPLLPNDHVIVAVNPALAVGAWQEWHGRRVLSAGGKEGADLALLGELADPAWVAARFDQVVIGSGDGVFAPVVAALRGFGLAVGVVSLARSLSRALAREASFVRLVSEPVDGMVAA